MTDNKPVEITEEVTIQAPMSGAAMKQRLDELKKEKEINNKKQKGDRK